ncbi:family 16 glycoside hydrolase [uncultured Croceitalea sp.]|uniref:family 16 glycoside hydrolase n=1 Tax=uncultured Croceitalea sp. TaxID=1798908 RepID=UPI0033056A73
MRKTTNIIVLALLGTMISSCAQSNGGKEQIAPEELTTWQTFDKGKTTVQGDELIVEETEGSDGYFMISPKKYADDFTLTYKVKAMSESTVLITLFSVTQNDGVEGFQLPAHTATPREVWNWRSEMEHYNLTINNSSHGNTPFFFKNVNPNFRGFYQNLKENIMKVGQWYDVEIGKKENRLWFKLDNKTYFDVEDCNPFSGGQLIFRISGTTGEKVIFAKAAFKDIVISYE